MKQSKLIISIVLFSIVLIVGGVSFAYYVANIGGTGNQNQNSSQGQTDTLEDLKIQNGNSITSNNLIPGESVSTTFTVTNPNSISVYYELLLSEVENTFVNTKDLEITLKKGDKVIVQNKTFPTKEEILRSGLSIFPNTTENFTLEVTYKETEENQIEDMGKHFNGKIIGRLTEQVTGVEYIRNLSTEDSNSLVYDNTVDNNLRYIGANPNNYVRFNNELWRIIGVMNNIDDGNGNKDSRLKIIRDESIGRYSWDSSNSTINNGYGVNEWSQAKLNTLLNDYYYNAKSNQTCYNGRNNATTPCDFSSIGLNDTTFKNMIDTVVWNTGTNGTNSITDSSNGLASHFYTYERSDNTGKICTGGTSCNDMVIRTTTWIGKIALIYPSDYGFATGGNSRKNCINLELSNWDDNRDCYSNDWLFNSSVAQWSLSPHSSSGNYAYFATYIHGTGYVHTDRAINVLVVFPTLYLKSNVKITSGIGTSENPYILEM